MIFWIYGFYETYKEVKVANGEKPDLINEYKSLKSTKKNVAIIFIALIVIISVFVCVGSFYVPDYSSGDSSDYYYTSSSGGGSSDSPYSSHYGGVDTMPDSIARDDPDWYYDHYEYGDDFDIDDYLESEGYD